MKIQNPIRIIALISLLTSPSAFGLYVPLCGGTWKGCVDVIFEGKCTDTTGSNAIPEVVVLYPPEPVSVPVEKIHLIRSAESENSQTSFSPITISQPELKTVVTVNGRYAITLRTSTCNGTTGLSWCGLQRRLSPSNEPFSFTVTAKGYKPLIISIPKNKVLANQANKLNLVLEKE